MPINEVGYGLDDFQKPLILNPIDSIGNILEHIFTQRQGSQPSDPSKYIDIRQYLYKHQGTIDENTLKRAIMSNCMYLFNYIGEDDIRIAETVRDGIPILLVNIRAEVEGSFMDFLMAFQNGPMNDLQFSFTASTPENKK